MELPENTVRKQAITGEGVPSTVKDRRSVLNNRRLLNLRKPPVEREETDLT
ncbi:MAG: hypothetical protein JWM81_349 [Candidatus Saccharibacteria bacterium]|nr:hypothetical protein [Candidatus Saccharibacteria bacterium]